MNNIYAFIVGLPLLLVGIYLGMKLIQGYGGKRLFYRGLILIKNPKLKDRIRLGMVATILTLVGILFIVESFK